MFLSRVIAVASLLVAMPAYALNIKTPDRIENGAIIPIEVLPQNPLTSGQQLELLVDGQLAAQLKVVSGKITSLDTRVKGTRNASVVTARVLANGSEREKGSWTLNVVVPARMDTTLTASTSVKAKSVKGGVRVLINSANGFSGTLVLQGAGFHVHITSGPAMSRNPLVGLKGDISGPVTATIDGQSVRVAQSAVPVSTTASPTPPAAAAPSNSAPATARIKSTRQVTDEIKARYERKISAARDACESGKSSCETRCAAEALAQVLARTGDTTAHLRCTSACNEESESCEQGIADLEQEKRDAIADARNPSNQSGGGSGPTGTIGSAQLISLSPPGNARSRNECIRFKWLREALPRVTAPGLAVPAWEDPDFFGTSRKHTDYRQQKVLVASNTCKEDLIVAAFSCYEVSEAGSSVLRKTGFSGFWNMNLHHYEAPGYKYLDVAVENIRDLGKRGSFKRQAISVFYGAWPRSEITKNPSSGPLSNLSWMYPMPGDRLTPAGEVLGRRHVALDNLAKKVLGIDGDPVQRAPGTRFHGWVDRGVGIPDKKYRRPGEKNCAAFRASSVWNSTQ